MHCHRFLPSLFSLPFFLVARIPQSLGNPACSEACFKCGGIFIGYPFFGDSRLGVYGLLGLQLECKEQIATIDILNVRYQVLHICEDNQTLQIARKNFMNDFCHPQFGNSTLDSTIFNIALGYCNVTLFYDYTSVIPLYIKSYNCNTNKGSHENVSIVTSVLGPEVCACNITIPIHQTSLQ
ncbi:Uncharacterized protein TCM_019378 [Theobroma cacao]|uniref:Wall-associated receptor kinase galacturonan-binding domain-containing protein n=1 Tax=Theobroma cacao TaxID=3641 RepID=A0A061EP61_THECC|nr:Uncharacterized protein TCM_019378 [Theobroma cacao]